MERREHTMFSDDIEVSSLPTKKIADCVSIVNVYNSVWPLAYVSRIIHDFSCFGKVITYAVNFLATQICCPHYAFDSYV